VIDTLLARIWNKKGRETAVFGSSILGMHSRECIPTRMHFREYIL
jgi:hypothetical protein